MANTSLISVRIDKYTLDRIERYTESLRYWKRNAVINQLLTALMDCSDKEDLDKMVRYSRFAPNKKFKIQIISLDDSETKKPP